MLIDTHAHLNFEAFNNDWKEVAKRALDAGIWIINVGSNLETSKRAVEIAENFEEGVYAAVGLHPIHVLDENFDIAEYEKLATHPKVVAFGEVGLDYYHLPTTIKPEQFSISGRAVKPGAESGREIKTPDDIKNLQKEVLKEFINLSQKMRLPLILHCRDGVVSKKEIREQIFAGPDRQQRGLGAHRELLDILYEFDTKSKKFDTRGVVHCFSGDWEQALRYFNLDFLISFTGIITFAHYEGHILKKAPLNKIMVETDCPYLAPEPMRGRRNEPIYVEYVAREIASVKELSYEEVVKQTTENALCLFSKITKVTKKKPTVPCRVKGASSARKKFSHAKK
jgi:TatD DNase family protein